jgi:hypothetical protein
MYKYNPNLYDEKKCIKCSHQFKENLLHVCNYCGYSSEILSTKTNQFTPNGFLIWEVHLRCGITSFSQFYKE